MVVRLLTRLMISLAVAGVCVPVAWAQTPDPPTPLTAASTDCSTASSCVTMSAPANGVTIALAPVGGTFQAEFEMTGNGGRSWVALDMFPPGSTTAAENATAAGTWRGAAGGLVRVRLSSCSSCSVLVTLTPLTSPPTSGGGSGGGGTTQADDDASIAAGQNMDLMASLGMVFNGTAWVRNTFGTAGSASAQVWTVQGVASMTPLLANPGTATLWGVHAEDSPHSSTHAGLQIFGVRQDSQVDFGADGDYVPISINDAGEVRVAFAGAAGGTSLADDGDFTAGTTPGTPAMGFYQSSVTACTDGDACTVGITAQRTQKVTLFTAAGVELTPSADMTVGSAFGATGPGLLTSYKEFDGSALPTTTNVSAEEEANPIATTLQGVPYGFLVNENGSKELGKLEDDAHATADYGMPVWTRRIDTPATSAGSSADYATLDSSPEGALYTTPIATAGISAGCTPNSIISANTVNETAIKATAGNLYWLNLTNNGANEVFFKLYNDTTANIDETDTPVARVMIPGNAAGAGNTVNLAVPIAFSTAITFRITGLVADNDTTAIAANEVLVSYCAK